MTTSYVIVRKSDNKALFETTNKRVADAINTTKYKSIPIMEYLKALNERIKNGNEIHA